MFLVVNCSPQMLHKIFQFVINSQITFLIVKVVYRPTIALHC